MKKTTKNITDQNSKLDPLSDTNESNPNIDGADEFVLFPLDVQETGTVTQNSTDSQEDDFILFPLDVKKTSTSTNNPTSITNKKPNKPKRQFVTKPNPKPVNVNPQPAPGPTTPKPIITSPKSNKLRNLFWLIVICLSIYTCKNKENDEGYFHFFNKTIHRLGKKINKVKLIFINENDFKEFKKDKKIIYSPYREFIEDESGDINVVEGDSLILIKPTGVERKNFYIPIGKSYFAYKTYDYRNGSWEGQGEYREKYSKYIIYLDIDENSYNQYKGSTRVNVNKSDSGVPIEVYYKDITFDDDETSIEIKYMRNRIEDFKKNTIMTKFISKSLLVDKTETNILPKNDYKSDSINPKIINKRNISIDNVKSKNNLKIIKTTSPEIIDDNTIYNYSSIKIKPNFPGSFRKFVASNYRTPDEEGLSGEVYVTFVVEKDGSLSDIKVVRDIGFGTGKEAIRVIKSCPKWNPGEQNGKKVRVLFSLPINIQTAE